MENNNYTDDIKSYNINVLISFFTGKWYFNFKNTYNLLVIGFIKINWNHDIFFSFLFIF